MRIALTGGIACGKSLFAKYLSELGVETLDADDIVHELIPPDERRALAAKVFADSVERKALEARIHPIVKRRIDEWFAADDGGGAGEPRLKVAIIPLLFEVHWDAEYDIILCVASSVERQIERMTAMRGYSREEALSRLSAQMDLSEKARKSHVVIQNDGSAENLREEAERVVRHLAEMNRR